VILQRQLLAPILSDPLSGRPFTTAYPFSVASDRPINITEAFDLFRDYYEGIVFDLAAPLAGGAFENPYRIWGPFDVHDRLYPDDLEPGAWARLISTKPCGYLYLLRR